MFYDIQKHIQLLQTYIKAQNKPSFIQELKHPSEKLLLQILTSKIDSIQLFKKQLNKLQINQKFKQQILKYRLKAFISQKDETSDKDLLVILKQIFLPSSNFNYPKPVNARRDQMVDEAEDPTQKTELLSKNIADYINQKVQQDISFMNKLDLNGWSQLCEATIMNFQWRQKQKYFRQNKLLCCLNPDTLDKLLKRYLNERKKQNKLSQPNLDFTFPFEDLSKQQINHLAKKNKDLFFNASFCNEWIRQNYSYFLRQYSQASSQPLQVEQKNLKELSRIYYQLQEKNESFYVKQFQIHIATEILATEIQLKTPQLKTFEEYVKDKNNKNRSLSAFSYFTQKFKSTLNQRQDSINKNFAPNYTKFYQFEKPRGFLRGAAQLFEDYILELFKKELQTKAKSSIEQLSEIIQLNYLKKIQSKAKLTLGEKCEEATDYWVANQLVALKQKKQIKIGSRNKTIYKTSDQVVLTLTLKNIRQLEIKVYQINLLKDYLTNNSSEQRVYDDLNLAYFSPTFTDYFVNPSDNPFEYREVVINVKGIPNKLGLFIIDFQGQGIVSRAIIRKGCIICLQKDSFEGRTFCFYDQDGKQLIESDGLEVWVEKQKKSLQKNFLDSKVLDSESVGDKTQIIAGVGCFAQKFIKKFKRDYNLKIEAIYTNQSFISGNKAKVILKGDLKLNNNQITLKKLKKIKAIVNQSSDKVIISSNTYSIAELSDLREISLQFFILRDISSINIQLKAEVVGEKQCSIQSNKLQILITSQTKKQEEIIAQPYLTQLTNNDYQLQLKGKNGEPIKQSQVNLDFKMKGTLYIQKFKFFTDNEGKVNLGPLTLVSNVACTFNNQLRNWSIDKSSEVYCYNTKMYALPGQDLCLPVNKSWTMKDISLIHHLAHKSQRLDETEHVNIKSNLLIFKVTPKSSSSYYKLTFIPLSIQITIEVLNQGNLWKEERLNRKIIIDANQQKIMQIDKSTHLRHTFIQKIKVESESSDKIAIKFDLANADSLSKQQLNKMRFHVFALNYLTPSIDGTFSPSQYFKEPTLKEENRQLNKSAFLNNKILSEEAAYIFNRQNEKKRIGSNLQKPGVFLKRLAVRQTHDVVGELAGQGGFEIRRRCRQAKDSRRRDRSYSVEAVIRKQRILTQHNSFLRNSGFVKPNLAFGEIVQIPKLYNHIQVYLVTPQSGSKYSFNIAEHSVASKDIRFKGLAQCTKQKLWNISQQAYDVKTNQTKLFQKECEYKIITLAQVFQYAQKVILANSKQKLYSWKDTLLLWDTYSSDQKIKFYNKYYSHQMNTFIKFKDQKFFQAVVRPFISNKFKKSVIDLCLLQDPSVVDFLQFNKLAFLNAFESALLVRVLIKLNKKELAERVVNRLKLQQQGKLPFKVNNKNFDYIINSFAGKQQLKFQPFPIPIEEAVKGESKFKGALKALKRQTSQMARSQYGQSESQQYANQRQRSESRQIVKKKKPVEVDSTKQYTEYSFYYDKNYTYPQHQKTIINSIYWVELSDHFLKGGVGNFTSPSFTEFSSALETMLAAAFIPGRQSNLYSIEQEGSNYKLSAKIDLLLFVKELKQYPFVERSGMYIYQAVISSSTAEPGKQVAALQIKSGEKYNINTIFNNSTSESLQLQVLSPIPQGAIALDFKEISLVQVKLGPYSTHVHKQKIYFPQSGTFKLHTANILNQRQNLIVSHSQKSQSLKVIQLHQTKALETFEDIIRFGTKSAIIQFLKTKNIFLKQIFNAQQILWMLSDKNFFNQILLILKQRLYFEAQIWKFGFLHGNCKAMIEYIQINEANSKGIRISNEQRRTEISNEAFQYYPYFQKRAHRYANQNRSAIKNVDLKEAYISFLIALTVSANEKQPKNILTYAYYLVLQDRLIEAEQIIKGLTEEGKKVCEIQLDYLNCFLDMSINGNSCTLAKTIAVKYESYPVKEWRVLFHEILETLKEPPANETEDKETVQTKVTLAENGDLHIHRSTKNQICIEIFPTNLELFYSQHSFQFKKAISDYSISKPAKAIIIGNNEANSEIIIKKEEFQHINNPYLEVIQHSKVTHRRIKSIFWINPRIKTKAYEQQGIIQIFADGKRAPGSYVKVFNLRKGNSKAQKALFYVDGYTDITGKFKYALTDLSNIQKFALLIITQVGSIVKFVSPPKGKLDEYKKRNSSSSSSDQSSSDDDLSESSGKVLSKKRSEGKKGAWPRKLQRKYS